MNFLDSIMRQIAGIVDAILGLNPLQNRIPKTADKLTTIEALKYGEAYMGSEEQNSTLAAMQPAAYLTPSILNQQPNLIDAFVSKVKTSLSLGYSEYNQLGEQQVAEKEQTGQPVKVALDKPSITFYIGIAVILLIVFYLFRRMFK